MKRIFFWLTRSRALDEFTAHFEFYRSFGEPDAAFRERFRAMLSGPPRPDTHARYLRTLDRIAAGRFGDEH